MVSRLDAGVTSDSFDHSIETLLHDLRSAAIDHHYPERGTADNQFLRIPQNFVFRGRISTRNNGESEGVPAAAGLRSFRSLRENHCCQRTASSADGFLRSNSATARLSCDHAWLQLTPQLSAIWGIYRRVRRREKSRCAGVSCLGSPHY
jgi:hypothetical protein